MVQDANQPRLDALGDPLPPGAILRLGSIRLRHGTTLTGVAYSPTSDLVASGDSSAPIVLSTAGFLAADW